MIKDLIIEYLRIKKQKSVCEIVKDMLKKDIKTIIDVGANKGEFSKAALNVFEQAKVYSFEPIPSLFKDYLLIYLTSYLFSELINKLAKLVNS